MSERSLGRGTLRRLVRDDGRVAYRADYTDASGKRRRVHVGHDRLTAEKALAKRIRERDLVLAGLAHEEGLDLAVSDVVEQYLAEIATRSKPRAVEDTRKILARIVGELGVVLVRHVTKARVVAWRQKRSREGASNKTINNAVVSFAAALNFAVSLGQLAVSPLHGLKALPITAAHQRRRSRALTPAELDALLDAAERYDRKARGILPRTPLLVFLVGTGARWSEAVSTRWSDVDLELGSVTLRGETTKTQKTRSIPLHESVLEALRGLHARECAVRGRPPFRGDPVFRTPEGATWPSDAANFRRYLHALLELAKIPYRDETGRVIHVHAMRKTFVTRMARAGIPTAIGCKLSGHASVQMLVQIYSDVSAGDARDAIRTLPPLKRVAPQADAAQAETA